TWTRTAVSTRGGYEQRDELVDVHRLGEMSVEAGPDGLAHVLGLAIAGERDEPCHVQMAPRPDATRDFEAVDVWQTDVAEDEVRPQPLRDAQPVLAALGRFHHRALDFEHQLQDVARVDVVLDDQHRLTLQPRPSAHGGWADGRLRPRQRQLDAKARAVTE